MEKHRSLYTVFPVLLSFVGFLSMERLGMWAAGRLMPGAWAGELAAFLIAYGTGVFMYRGLAQEKVPEIPACTLPMAAVHIGYGLLWLLAAMYAVLLLFPVEGDPVPENLWPRLLVSVGIHPILEELLFRRLYFRRLLTLAMPEQRTDSGETAEQDTASAGGPPGRGHSLSLPEMLFAILLQAILFALAHSGGGGMLYGFAGGVILGVLMLRTGRLWVPVVCHMLINLRSVTYAYQPPVLRAVLDTVWIAAGLACGILFWSSRIRARRAGTEDTV